MAQFTKRIALLAIFTGVLISSSAALAHAHLQSQSPASDTEISPAPQAITLHFSEGVEPNFSGIQVTGPEKLTVKVGKAQRDAKDEKQLIIPVEENLQPGRYTVEWHVVSVDGHKTQGNYQFTVK